jgi:DNA-binding response OmpR family regulator
MYKKMIPADFIARKIALRSAEDRPGEMKPNPNLKKPKLLVVEDDNSVRESLRKLLEAKRYEVFCARDASEATELFNCHRIDLVVLDINLRPDNGWSVFERMTAINPFVPTIVITAECGQREKAVTLGVEGLIEKPIDVPVFLKMIRALLAETTEARLKRICGNDAYCHYVGRHYEPYLRMLQERYNAPLRFSAESLASLEANPAVPTVITSSSDVAESVGEGAVCSDPDNQKERKEEFL